jgi:hypothetical protein
MSSPAIASASPRSSDGDWMYTGGRSGVVHWSRSNRSLSLARWSLCGVETPFGTGSQTEYERAAALRHCANCVRLGAPSG